MILIGGIAIVVWRIYGKKRHSDDDEDDELTSDGSIRREKRQGSGTPFQTNLEQYHAPSGRVNAASNF